MPQPLSSPSKDSAKYIHIPSFALIFMFWSISPQDSRHLPTREAENSPSNPGEHNAVSLNAGEKPTKQYQHHQHDNTNAETTRLRIYTAALERSTAGPSTQTVSHTRSSGPSPQTPAISPFPPFPYPRAFPHTTF